MADRGRGFSRGGRGASSNSRGGPPGSSSSGPGGRGGAGGAGRGGGRGGVPGPDRGGRGGGHGGPSGERAKKEAILDLGKYKDKKIRVKFTGGREVIGVLKGYDQLMNMVLDEVEEEVRHPETGELTGEKRALGLAVLRGTALTVINPADGFEEIENPFAHPE
ncbi:U6 snRNA-associated Sm-like protein LSm7 [Tilletiaria anomala UBC 951]|uniref:U6 snRNA-associated Sm-like protein LSm7 n=1 Tax=Tilletiaria anomala (strain ATCC 24038 / CBS 436.72 / UBC 951) TaxID=1037660 RepID=A0A066VUF1_TILAU|nr:U6 snRNA-associated Sm-like protein LSm7 [Tilletiaria anomala UBC 951]KDN42200.1 U6 snRNA-associated Sm-like protein LSm7 [Tilletiaria anomala UBC 951]